METDNVPQQPQEDIESISDCPGVILEENTEPTREAPQKERRIKRVLHFWDGDMIEYATEDEADAAPKAEAQVATVNPKNLTWMPWAWYQTVMIGSKVLHGCDYVGEALAGFLGITSPKYQFEIEEYKRIQAMQEEENASQDLEMGGWSSNRRNNLISKQEEVPSK